MHKATASWWAFGLALVAGCATTEYVGESYTPTAHVDVVFSMDDLERPHKVMGEASTEGSEYMSFESIEQQLVKDAMAKGADAVVIEGMDTVVIGSTTSRSGDAPDSPRYVVTQDGQIKNVGGSGHYSGFESTTTMKDKVIRAKLIKYVQ